MIVSFEDYARAAYVGIRHTQLFTELTAKISEITIEELELGDPDTRKHIRVDFEVYRANERPHIMPLYLWPASKDPDVKRSTCRSIAAIANGCYAHISDAPVDDADPTGSMYDILMRFKGQMITIQCRTDDIPAKWGFLIDKYEAWD